MASFTQPMDDVMTNNLEEVVAVAAIPDTWDVLIVGDGAGCWWDGPCGWGCALIDRHLKRRRAFYGGLSTGSIAIAELLPTVHAMLWYAEFHGHARKKALRRGTLNVHVITDNAPTVSQWNSLTRGGAKAQKIRRKRPLWNILLQLERAGYIFHFHWVPRNTIGLNVTADKLSRIARRTIAEVALKFADADGHGIDHEIYTIDASA
jgi:hypothetical protein